MPRIDAHGDTAATPAPGLSYWARAGALVVARPRLWVTAVRQARRLARARWWSRAPYLPLPDPDYLRFRFETQYGTAEPAPRDVVAYLEWCRAMDAAEEAHTARSGRR